LSRLLLHIMGFRGEGGQGATSGGDAVLVLREVEGE